MCLCCWQPYYIISCYITLEFIHITAKWSCCWPPTAVACTVTYPQPPAGIWTWGSGGVFLYTLIPTHLWIYLYCYPLAGIGKVPKIYLRPNPHQVSGRHTSTGLCTYHQTTRPQLSGGIWRYPTGSIWRYFF